MSAPVTVAVVSWNTRELLERCLRSLEPDHRAGLAEVWVVDNGSTDGSAELVEREFDWVRLVRAEENLGFGRAVNVVARRSESDWIAPANADVAVEPGALRALVEAGGRISRAGAVAPRLVLPGGETQHSVHPFPTLPFTLLFNLGLHRLRPSAADRLCLEGFWNPERPREVDWALGAFLLVRRDAFEAVGGFDERLWLYAEDVDLGWRLAKAGHPTYYEPAARVNHEQGAAAVQAFGADQTRAWMEATYTWLALRRGPAIAILTGLLNVAGAAVRLNSRWLRAHVRGLAALRRGQTPLE